MDAVVQVGRVPGKREVVRARVRARVRVRVRARVMQVGACIVL